MLFRDNIDGAVRRELDSANVPDAVFEAGVVTREFEGADDTVFVREMSTSIETVALEGVTVKDVNIQFYVGITVVRLAFEIEGIVDTDVYGVTGSEDAIEDIILEMEVGKQ